MIHVLDRVTLLVWLQVGVTGFCMGGALSLASAVKVAEISAAAPFYGIPDANSFDVSTITIPVQAHFGEKDDIVGFSSPEDAKKLAERMKNNDKFELHMYPCGHAFTNPSGPLGTYDKEQCEIALQRLYEFMNKYLAWTGLVSGMTITVTSLSCIVHDDYSYVIALYRAWRLQYRQNNYSNKTQVLCWHGFTKCTNLAL